MFWDKGLTLYPMPDLNSLYSQVWLPFGAILLPQSLEPSSFSNVVRAKLNRPPRFALGRKEHEAMWKLLNPFLLGMLSIPEALGRPCHKQPSKWNSWPKRWMEKIEKKQAFGPASFLLSFFPCQPGASHLPAAVSPGSGFSFPFSPFSHWPGLPLPYSPSSGPSCLGWLSQLRFPDGSVFSGCWLLLLLTLLGSCPFPWSWTNDHLVISATLLPAVHTFFSPAWHRDEVTGGERDRDEGIIAQIWKTHQVWYI